MDERTVGILGGMGSKATADLLNKIISKTPASKDQDHLHIMIDCNPKIPDRVKAIEEHSQEPAICLGKMARKLQQSGADFLLLACITAHYYIDAIQKEVQIPVINSLQLVADYLKDRTEVQKVGLLATDAVLSNRLFHNYLEKIGIQIIVPSSQDQKILMHCLREIKVSDEHVDTLRKEAVDIVKKMRENGVQLIIEGCTEAPVLLRGVDQEVSFLDVSELTAEAAVKIALRTTAL